MGALVASVALTGCSGNKTVVADLPTGAAALQAIERADVPAPDEYLMAPTDVLSLRVFDEPEFSMEEVRVDDAGNLQVPVIGQIKAADRTIPDVAAEITRLLGEQYLRDPRVSLALTTPAKRYVTVEGEVEMPGVYEFDRNFTLLSALARAQSPTMTAKLDQVIILRTLKGRRMAARFDVRQIRGGAAPDPLIRDGDVITVGYSAGKGVWQDLLKAAPIFNSFVYLATR